ncbi:hypothetical protein GCM10010174_79030 [Kutzneria viridogrisea]|uniref:Uncharacterized protein n=1 Tax=Kutzneria viridogrisea TaxID=47990 RepID=A0ABR6BA97_9PSEU|nr:hypothetical protein [Kutzneria viridogrisea]
MQGQGGPGGWWRQQLANLYGLLAISMMMFDGREADDIVRLAVTTVPSLNAGEVVAVYVVADGRLEPVPRGPVPDPELDRHVRDLGEAGGEIVLADGMWRWAYPLTGLGAGIGRLVVKASRGPSPDEFFLLRALGQQLSAALANASMHRCERVGCHKSATNADQQLQAASSCSLIRLQARGAPGARAHTAARAGAEQERHAYQNGLEPTSTNGNRPTPRSRFSVSSGQQHDRALLGVKGSQVQILSSRRSEQGPSTLGKTQFGGPFSYAHDDLAATVHCGLNQDQTGQTGAKQERGPKFLTVTLSWGRGSSHTIRWIYQPTFTDPNHHQPTADDTRSPPLTALAADRRPYTPRRRCTSPSGPVHAKSAPSPHHRARQSTRTRPQVINST